MVVVVVVVAVAVAVGVAVVVVVVVVVVALVLVLVLVLVVVVTTCARPPDKAARSRPQAPNLPHQVITGSCLLLFVDLLLVGLLYVDWFVGCCL